MHQIFSKKFKSARLRNGLSLQELADRMNNVISRQSLHKYEKGEAIPSNDLVDKLAEALNVTADFFFTETSVELGVIEFRKLHKLQIKEENVIKEKAKDYLERYLELENIVGIQAKFLNPLEGTKNINSFEEIERASQKVRAIWEMGNSPVSNVVELLEEKHIKVVFIDAGDAFDGMQTWIVNHGIPVIAINESRVKSDDRKRFTAMHELCHLLLPMDNHAEEIKEKFCHQFAAAMLFPAEAMKRELGEQRSRLSFQELGVLKQQYGISMQAIIMRALDLKIISESYCRQLFSQIRQLGWKIEEPFPYRGIEGSNRFDQLLFRGIVEGVISIDKAAALKNQTAFEFQQRHIVF